MNRTFPLLAIAAATAVLTACGAAPQPATAPIAPVAAPQPSAVPSAAVPATSATPAAAAVEDRGARVDADDQSGDGSTVVVREALVTAGPGWVAVRADDDGGVLLGSAPLTPGAGGPVTVPLTTPVPAGDDDTDLEVVLHLDDGDGVFDEQRDPRVLDADDADDADDDDRDDDVEDDDLDYRRG